MKSCPLSIERIAAGRGDEGTRAQRVRDVLIAGANLHDGESVPGNEPHAAHRTAVDQQAGRREKARVVMAAGAESARLDPARRMRRATTIPRQRRRWQVHRSAENDDDQPFDRNR
jgi:hypothetical protein